MKPFNEFLIENFLPDVYGLIKSKQWQAARFINPHKQDEYDDVYLPLSWDGYIYCYIDFLNREKINGARCRILNREKIVFHPVNGNKDTLDNILGDKKDLYIHSGVRVVKLKNREKIDGESEIF